MPNRSAQGISTLRRGMSHVTSAVAAACGGASLGGTWPRAAAGDHEHPTRLRAASACSNRVRSSCFAGWSSRWCVAPSAPWRAGSTALCSWRRVGRFASRLLLLVASAGSGLEQPLLKAAGKQAVDFLLLLLGQKPEWLVVDLEGEVVVEQWVQTCSLT